MYFSSTPLDERDVQINWRLFKNKKTLSGGTTGIHNQTMKWTGICQSACIPSNLRHLIKTFSNVNIAVTSISNIVIIIIIIEGIALVLVTAGLHQTLLPLCQ